MREPCAGFASVADMDTGGVTVVGLGPMGQAMVRAIPAREFLSRATPGADVAARLPDAARAVDEGDTRASSRTC